MAVWFHDGFSCGMNVPMHVWMNVYVWMLCGRARSGPFGSDYPEEAEAHPALDLGEHVFSAFVCICLSMNTWM